MPPLNHQDEELLPREKLATLGADRLSDQELVAVLLRTGSQKHNVLTLAAKIVQVVDDKGLNLALDDITSIHGIGLGKASQVIAALEFSRRRIRPEGLKIKFPSDVMPLLHHYCDRKQEHFISITVNAANEVLKTRVITIGLIDKSHVHPREVFADAITDRASAIIVAHNHPTGNIEPSRADIEITKTLKEAGKILGISVLDHLIFGNKGYYSFAENEKI